jgi:uncharacterized Zn finger protein
MPPRRWSAFRPYVSAETQRERAAAAARRLAKHAGKTGRAPAPVTISGRQITTTFWGDAWCRNLESYADFAYRLERGRSYVRRGAVVDLLIAPERVEAKVSGTELYDVVISIAPLAQARWNKIARISAGRIGSLVGLLRGELPDEVMQTVTDKSAGLFPDPDEMTFQCSCPDWAQLCKHVAAALYGIGARLDTQPELLFVLRAVEPQDLIEKASGRLGAGSTKAVPTLAFAPAELGALFGIDLVAEPEIRPRTAKGRAKRNKGGRP